jgi:low temperature requirement protein LtrA
MSLRSLASPEGQGATFVELFFDLVFVFAVTQVTHYAAVHLDLGGILRSILVFWLVWWAWTQFTWALNAADTDHHQVRLGTLVSTGVAFVMAVSVEGAFGGIGDALWFAIPYVAVRLLGLGLYYRVAASPEQRAAVLTFALASFTGLAAVIAGALTPPSLRAWLWLGAILLDLGAAGLGARRAGWNLHAEHFAERHGLIVIIALGESLIIAGAAVAADERTGGFVAVGATALAATCLLWWTYFGWVKDALEERLVSAPDGMQAPMARDAYSLWHFPLVGGIIAYAVGVEGIMAHPDERVALGVAVALASGMLLFVLSTAGALWRAAGQLLVRRVGIVLVTVAAVMALALVEYLSPVWLLVAACLGLGVIVAVEHFLCVRGGHLG